MFSMHYCSYNAVNPDRDQIYRPAGRMDYLFLLFLTEMEVRLESGTKLAKPGACILYTPGTPQDYQAVGAFQNSYVHFDCTMPELFEQYRIPCNEVFYPQNTEELQQQMKRISREYLTQPPYYEIQMNMLLEQLFLLIGRDSAEQSAASENQDVYRKFSDLRLRVLESCEQNWSVEQMCEVVGFGKSQFHSLYQQFFHTTPKADLQKARLDLAKYLLTNESMQVQQVAEQAGFRNLYHFSRYFRECCGCSPREYARKQIYDRENGEKSYESKTD